MSFINKFGRKLGVLEYLGTWDAHLNEPALSSGVGQRNGYYVVSVNGQTSLDGVTGWEAGDWAIFNGSVWEQIDNQRSDGFIDGGTPVEENFDSGFNIDGGEEV